MRDRGDEKDLNDTIESFVGYACGAAVMEEKLNELLAYVRSFEAFLDVYRPSFSSEVRKRRPEWLKIESDAVPCLQTDEGE